MKMNKVTSVEDYKIVSSFQSLRKTLLDDKFADRLEKPLAYWALPNDRRLPLAFLGRTIKDLLATPFEELSATPGIGQKKIGSLVKLLSRATKDHPPAVPFGLTELSESSPKKTAAIDKTRPLSSFDPSLVSEALWAQWQETVVKHGIGGAKLGHLAHTLQALPTVIWHTPLETYVNHTVAEIRQLKTHGEKRVRVVLEVFCLVHEMLQSAETTSQLALRIMPKFVLPIETWIEHILERPGAITAEEIRDHLSLPLLAQIKVDAGDPIHELAENRLGVKGAPHSVRQQSKQMGVTRARVYQLLEECSRIMNVRWPEGQHWFARLDAKLKAETTDPAALQLFRATYELFYPDKCKLPEDENGAHHDGLAHHDDLAVDDE